MKYGYVGGVTCRGKGNLSLVEQDGEERIIEWCGVSERQDMVK